MPKLPPKPRPVSAPVIEHDRLSVLRNFTAWHHLLAGVLQKTAAPGLEVHSFVRLGTLPLEADVIILRLDDHADIAALAQHFGFLVPALRRYLVIEYKSPEDRLTLSDFDTVRAYAMLCKRKYEVVHDEEVAVALLYSRHESQFFVGCARNSFPFVEAQPGVRQSCQQALAFYAMDLVALGERQPENPINLLSSRGRTYGAAGLPTDLGPFGVLYEEVFLRELKQMGQMHVPGSQELLDDAKGLKELILSKCSPEERLRGLPAEERLRGLPAEERLRGLPAEERLRGLPAEERLRGLTRAELARLRKLLLK